MPSKITTTLATEEDAPTLVSLVILGFSTSDAAYPLIWGGAPEGTHDAVALKGLFSPVQKEGRVTFKALGGERLVGFATWNLPKPKVETVEKVEEGEKKEDKGSGLPEIPGANTELWGDKLDGPKRFYYRDVDPSKDILLSLFFVDPEYQRQGIGSLLFQWGLKKADELGAKIWLTSTPKAASTYERNGWKVMERHGVDLGRYGGEGLYVRRWMLREPKGSV